MREGGSQSQCDVTFSNDRWRLSTLLLISEKDPRRCRQAAWTAGGQLERKGPLLHQIFSYLNCRELTANCRRLHGVAQAPRACWQNKYLLPGTVALVIYGTMRLWFHVPFAYFLAASVAKQVAGQCSSYTEYSQVGTLDSHSPTVST